MKRILTSILCFVLGLGVAVLFLANPLKWEWVHPLQHRILSYFDSSIDTGEGSQGSQLWTCGMHPQVIQDGPGNCPICGMALTPVQERQPSATQASRKPKIKHWEAPMDPTYISDKPGKSPMGMDLVPVYEEEEEDYTGYVHVSPNFVQTMGVQTTEVVRRNIDFTIRTIGTVAYDEKQLSLINVKYSGWIENVTVNYVGEEVRKGQKLFEIFSPELVTSQKEYLNALDYAERMSRQEVPSIRERADSLLQASRERLRYWDISDGQIRELEKNREPRRTVEVYSPVSGVVLSKMDQTLDGMYTRPGMNLYKIVDLSRVWVEAEVFEHQLPWLRTEGVADLEFPSLGGRKYRGRIRFILPYFEQKTRTAKVTIELDNADRQLRSEMYANVVFEVPSARNVLTVPEESVIHSGDRNIVVLDRGDGAFQVREVTLGVNGKGLWEVQDGVEEGDSVVVSSQFLIDSESNLREAISKMTGNRDSEGSSLHTPDGAHTH